MEGSVISCLSSTWAFVVFCICSAACSLLSGESPLWWLLITSCSCYPRMNNEQTPTCTRNTIVLNEQEILFKFLLLCNIFPWLYEQKWVKINFSSERNLSAKNVQVICPSVLVLTLHCSVQTLLKMILNVGLLPIFQWDHKIVGCAARSLQCLMQLLCILDEKLCSVVLW